MFSCLCYHSVLLLMAVLCMENVRLKKPASVMLDGVRIAIVRLMSAMLSTIARVTGIVLALILAAVMLDGENSQTVLLLNVTH